MIPPMDLELVLRSLPLASLTIPSTSPIYLTIVPLTLVHPQDVPNIFPSTNR